MTNRYTYTAMSRAIVFATVAGLTLATSACNDFLTPDDANQDPNRPTTATNAQLFVGAQTNTWALYGGELSRLSAMFVQQAEGVPGTQYARIYTYNISEGTTNGQHQQFYASGGLVDLRTLQQQAAASKDSLFWGIGQIMEAMQMSLAADVFGDLVYSKALTGGTPPLDPQATVYTALLAKLDSGITNVRTAVTPSATNVGPRTADLVYGGNYQRWEALAHTLKARIYMHLAKTDATNYNRALTEARLGINVPSGAADYRSIMSGNPGEMNLLFYFMFYARPGNIAVNPSFIARITGHARFDDFINLDYDDAYSENFVDATISQTVASFDENVLTWAEAAYRSGFPGEAQTQLDRYRAAHGIPTSSLSGAALLRAILDERYIALFHQVEAWNDYKRNCYPNLTPVVSGQKIPARLKYDANERIANPNIPLPSAQPARNATDPAATQDPFGNACLGQ